MSLPAPSGKLWVYQGAVDLRKSYNSLSALVARDLKLNPESGDGFYFRKPKKDTRQAALVGPNWLVLTSQEALCWTLSGGGQLAVV